MAQNKNNTLQAFWVASGSFASFAFAIISAAILSRYLSKHEYGTYRQVMYVYSSLLVIFTLGLPRAYSYFLPRIPKEEAYSLVRKLTTLFFYLGGIFSLILFFGAEYIADYLNNADLELSIKYFAIAPIFILPRLGLEGIFATYHLTHKNAIFTVVSRIFSLICVVIPVLLYKSEVNVAIIGFVISTFINAIIALYLQRIPFRGIEGVKSKIRYKEIFAFSIPLMAASIWSIITKSSDQFFLSRYFGTNEFAEFANGAMELPFVQMITSATSVVLLPAFSRLAKQSDNSSEVLTLWKNASLKSSKIIYPLVTYCWIYADVIMLFLYGDKYLNSGIYFRIFLTINFFVFVPYAPVMLAMGATKYYARVHMISAILVIGLEFIVVKFFPSPFLIAGTSIFVRFVTIALMLQVIKKIFKKSIKDLLPFKYLAAIFAISTFAGSLSYIILMFIQIDNLLLKLIVSFFSFSLFYYLLSYLFNIQYKEILGPVLRKILPHKYSYLLSYIK